MPDVESDANEVVLDIEGDAWSQTDDDELMPDVESDASPLIDSHLIGGCSSGEAEGTFHEALALPDSYLTGEGTSSEAEGTFDEALPLTDSHLVDGCSGLNWRNVAMDRREALCTAVVPYDPCASFCQERKLVWKSYLLPLLPFAVGDFIDCAVNTIEAFMKRQREKVKPTAPSRLFSLVCTELSMLALKRFPDFMDVESGNHEKFSDGLAKICKEVTEMLKRFRSTERPPDLRDSARLSARDAQEIPLALEDIVVPRAENPIAPLADIRAPLAANPGQHHGRGAPGESRNRESFRFKWDLVRKVYPHWPDADEINHDAVVESGVTRNYITKWLDRSISQKWDTWSDKSLGFKGKPAIVSAFLEEKNKRKMIGDVPDSLCRRLAAELKGRLTIEAADGDLQAKVCRNVSIAVTIRSFA